jgi:hypothetical protein
VFIISDSGLEASDPNTYKKINAILLLSDEKNRLVKLETRRFDKLFSVVNYNSNNNVTATVFVMALIVAPSVNPCAKNPCCEFLLA